MWQGIADATWDGQTNLPTQSWPYGSYNGSHDIYWYVTTNMVNPDAAAETDCVQHPYPSYCGQFSVKIRQDYNQTMTTFQQKNLVCHEIGHSVYFWPTPHGNAATSCMDGGGTGILGHWEIDITNFLLAV